MFNEKHLLVWIGDMLLLLGRKENVRIGVMGSVVFSDCQPRLVCYYVF